MLPLLYGTMVMVPIVVELAVMIRLDDEEPFSVPTKLCVSASYSEMSMLLPLKLSSVRSSRPVPTK